MAAATVGGPSPRCLGVRRLRRVGTRALPTLPVRCRCPRLALSPGSGGPLAGPREAPDASPRASWLGWTRAVPLRGLVSLQCDPGLSSVACGSE